MDLIKMLGLGAVGVGLGKKAYDKWQDSDSSRYEEYINAGKKAALEQPIENRAQGYTHYYFTGIGEAPFLDMSFCLGAGQLLSTVEDLYLFDKALYSDKLISKKSKELFMPTTKSIIKMSYKVFRDMEL